MSSADQPEDDAAAVLRILEESGVFDELRQQLLQQIQANVCLSTNHDEGLSRCLGPWRDKEPLSANKQAVWVQCLRDVAEIRWIDLP